MGLAEVFGVVSTSLFGEVMILWRWGTSKAIGFLHVLVCASLLGVSGTLFLEPWEGFNVCCFMRCSSLFFHCTIVANNTNVRSFL